MFSKGKEIRYLTLNDAVDDYDSMYLLNSLLEIYSQATTIKLKEISSFIETRERPCFIPQSIQCFEPHYKKVLAWLALVRNFEGSLSPASLRMKNGDERRNEELPHLGFFLLKDSHSSLVNGGGGGARSGNKTTLQESHKRIVLEQALLLGSQDKSTKKSALSY